jgi:hypothetical protein
LATGLGVGLAAGLALVVFGRVVLGRVVRTGSFLAQGGFETKLKLIKNVSNT